jgi:hypothetical protein
MGVEVVTFRDCAFCGEAFKCRGSGSGIPIRYCSIQCSEADVKPKAAHRSNLKRSPSKQKRRPTPISKASTAQRAAKTPCLVTGVEIVDQAHLWPRGMGGCNEPECVVSLVRPVHRALDEGRFDVLPYLVAHGRIAEIQHAVGHANGDLIALVERLTGCKVTLTPKTELLSVEDIERKWAA